MIPCCYHAHPFDDKPRSFRVEPGITLLEIVQQVTKQPDLFVLKLNGVVIEQEWWPRVRPKVPFSGHPTLVTLHPRPGDVDIGDILGIVATIAIIAGAALISGGALVPVLGAGFAAGTFGATAAAAGFGLVGSLAVSALTSPPISGNIQASAQGVEQQTVAGVALNGINPGDYLSMVLGTMRASPHPLMPSYTTLENGEIFVQGIVGLAGAYEINDIWLNGSPIDFFDDVEYSVRQGLPTDTEPDMNFDWSVKELTPRLKMDQTNREANSDNVEQSPDPDSNLSKWQVFHLPPPGDDGKMIIRLHWPGGMNSVQPDNDVLAGGIPFRVEIRPRSATDWYALPEIHFHQNVAHTGEIRQHIILQWQSTTTGTFVSDANLTAYAAYYNALSGQPFARLAAAEYNPGSGIIAEGVTADIDGFTIAIDNTVMDGDEEYDVRIRMGHSYTEVSFTVASYLYAGSAVSANQLWGYTGAQDNTSAKEVSPGEFVYVESISSWNLQQPFEWEGLASIAFKAKGVEISSLSASFTSMIPIWDGLAWTPHLVASNNPAALYRFVCTSPDYNSQPVLPGTLDEEILIEAWEECVNREYECNAVINNQSMPEVLQMISSTMFGSPKYVDQWGVILDRDRSDEDIIQMLTPLNSKDLGTVKEFPRLPHAIRAQYFNAGTEDHKFVDDVVAYAPGYDVNSATIYESITYQGFTNANKVLQRAQFDINQLYLRSVRYVRDVHNEGLVTPRGSLIGLSDDVVEHVHRYSIIKSVLTSGANVVGLQLESLIDLQALAEDETYVTQTGGQLNQIAVTVRLNDGSPSTHLILEQSDSAEVTFATPVANTGQFEVSQIVAIGIAGREYKRCLVMNVEPHKGGEVLRLYLADERPELYA